MNWTRKTVSRAAIAVAALVTGIVAAQAGSLKIESWRNDDADIWNSKIIPAFNKTYPDIKVEFAPSAPKEYNAALNARLAGGTAGDIIACRPFDASLDLFNKHQLDGLDDLKGMDSFSSVAKAAWQTDDGKTTFCVPMASVIHGFIYNEDAFKKIGATPPKTMAEFHDILDKLKKDGTYTPIDLGTADQWEAATMGFQNIGPDYWKGETGRLNLIAGKDKFTDPQYIAVFKELAAWAPYMGNGFQAQTYPDSQNLFSLGKAAIYPAGSWDISTFRAQAKFAMGAFPPPLPAGDYGMLHLRPHRHRDGPELGLQEQGRREEVSRMADDPGIRRALFQRAAGVLLAQHDAGRRSTTTSPRRWSAGARTASRRSATPIRFCRAARPNLENELWNVSAQVINGKLTPDAAGKQLQDGLDKWYKPAK